MLLITHFCGVKLLARKSGCVKFWTNIMSALMLRGVSCVLIRIYVVSFKHVSTMISQAKSTHTHPNTRTVIYSICCMFLGVENYGFHKGTWSEKYFLEFSLFRSIWLERPEKLIRRLSSPWVITSHLQQWLLLLQNQTWQWGTLSCANLLVVSCLKLKELGCVVDEGEENHTYYVSTSLAHVSLGIIFFAFRRKYFYFRLPSVQTMLLVSLKRPCYVKTRPSKMQVSYWAEVSIIKTRNSLCTMTLGRVSNTVWRILSAKHFWIIK